MQLDILKNDAQTEVGSYFVANYPPFSAWTAAHVPAAPRVLASKSDPGNSPSLGLYLHIPFCRKRCKFCYFRVFTDKNADEVETYLESLAREMALYARCERLAGRQFEFVYFGGGTPSFLSSAQLSRLVERIDAHFSWNAAREVTFECEPGTLRPGKLETIRSIGVTRLSLGVEHFDDEILEMNGRAHKSPEIYRAWEWIREIGFQQVNIDLIAGMVGETDEKWRCAVEEALKLEPDSLTIYQLELPHNAVFSREVKSGNVPPVATWSQKRRWAQFAFDKFLAAGYHVSSGYTLVRPSAHSGFVYRDSLWRGADMVGMGVASFSHVGGVHYQNFDRWEDYIGRLEAGELPIARAFPATKRQRVIRELVLQLKLGSITLPYFQKKFGVDVLADFAEAVASLRADGFVQANGGDEIRLTREGLLRVDALLPRFFEPEFRRARYT